MTIDQLTRDELASHVGTTLRLGDGVDVALVLMEVSPVRTSGPWESFSVVLRQLDGAPFAQRVYALDHTVLGTLALFLVPIAPDDLGFRYEAVFNRAVPVPQSAGG